METQTTHSLIRAPVKYASLWEAELMETLLLPGASMRLERYASLWEAELMETVCNGYYRRFLYIAMGNIAKPRHCFTDSRLLASFHLSLFGGI